MLVNAVPARRSCRQSANLDLAGRAVVVKVDTERFPSLAAQYNVRSIPNFAVFSRGKLQFQQAGLVDAATMESWLTRAA
jgi:thioredoxin 2